MVCQAPNTLSHVCSPRMINSPHIVCSQMNDCSSCTQNDHCGYCVLSQTCVPGNWLGPSDIEACSGGRLQYYYGQCTGICQSGVHVHITLAQADLQNRSNFANANSFTQADFDRCNIYSKCHRVHTVCHFLQMLLSFTEFRIQTTATLQWIKFTSPVIDLLSI